MKKILFFLLISLLGDLMAQRAIDTVDTKQGRMVIYSNQSWELIQDSTFDGILNPAIHEIMSSKEIGGPYTMKWDDNDCYSRANDLTKMKDTVWLCLDGDSLGEFTMPIDGPVTSRYKYRNGKFHNGIDLDLETGDTVVSAFDGVVRYARKNSGGFGNLVIIRHYNGLETYYAHLSKLLAFSGQKIKLGWALWHIFGASNQMLASLILMLLSIYFWKKNKPIYPLFIPFVFITITTFTSLLFNANLFIQHGNYFLLAVEIVLIFFLFWVLFEGFKIYKSSD